MTPEAWVGLAGLCLSIIGSAWWLGRELGEIKTRLGTIDRHMMTGAKKMADLDVRVDNHGERLARLETSLEV